MKEQHQPKFEYMRLPPSKWIFQYPRMQDWIYRKVAEVADPATVPVLNLFAGKTLLPDLNEYRVDIVEEFEEVKDSGIWTLTHADWVGDSRTFPLEYDKQKFPIALLDPPYNVRKSREKYGGRTIGSFTRIKNDLNNILSDSSRVITWGYSSVGMSNSRGYKLSEVLLICHSGDHSDTIVTVEDKIVDVET